MSYDFGGKMLQSLTSELDKTVFKVYISYLLRKYIHMSSAFFLKKKKCLGVLSV
jgi:hypothetical protein